MISAPTGRRNAFLQKKKMHGWTTNMIVIQIIIRFRVISLIMNIAIIRIITLEPLYCIASFHILFPEFFLLFSYQFYLFFLFSYQFLFFMFPLEFFSLFSHFFSVFSVYQVLYSVIRCKHAKKKKKKVWCVVSAMSSRSNQTSFRQARRKSMDWLDCISVHGSENSRVETHSKSQWL